LKVGADKELTFKVLGSRLRIDDGELLETAYKTNIGSFEQKLAIAPEAVQAILDEVAAKQVHAQDLIDRRYLDALEKSGFFQATLGEMKLTAVTLLALRGAPGLSPSRACTRRIRGCHR
jgi:hypothetical protein